VKLKTELDGETAKKVAASLKAAKIKKVQASIQGEQVRVTSPSKDDLQEAIQHAALRRFRRRAAVRQLPLSARMRFSVLTLGCDKNTVDSERYLADLSRTAPSRWRTRPRPTSSS
jgi:hypothetical protein